MRRAKPYIRPLTDEEEAAIQAGIAKDPDNPEWTAEDFKNAKPFKEVFPELYESWKRSRSEAKAATKELVSLHLDREVIEHFKAKGPRWQARINKVLRDAIAAEAK